jgi:hypothetical protein
MSTHLERVLEELVIETKKTNELLQALLPKEEVKPVAKKAVKTPKKEV